MGVLIRCASGERHRLAPRFLVGRSPENHLRLTRTWVSLLHAELLWQGSSWELHDLGSRNGTYIDGQRLDAGARKTVWSAMEIAFGSVGDPFVLLDHGPPAAVAVSDDGQRRESEDGLLILPDPDHPYCTIHDGGNGVWVAKWSDGTQHRVDNGGTLLVHGRTWRVELPFMAERTWDPAIGPVHVANAAMQITLREGQHTGDAREKPAEIRLHHGDSMIRLPGRTHHRVLLALAQARLDDEATGITTEMAGWIPFHDLLDLVDMDESQCNVYICRARQELARHKVADPVDLIERRPGTREVRLGVRKVEIIHA